MPLKPQRYRKRDKNSREARFGVKRIVERAKTTGIDAQHSKYPV